MDKITDDDLVQSFSISLNSKKQFKSNVNEMTHNRSFYFTSCDNRFLIKSISNSEKKKLISILDDLIKHFESTKNKSLMVRIYGLFELDINLFGSMNLIIMQSSVYLE